MRLLWEVSVDGKVGVKFGYDFFFETGVPKKHVACGITPCMIMIFCCCLEEEKK